jgi:hypothetical protein
LTQADIIRTEASFTNWFLRFGPIGFILGYSTILFGISFLLWNLTFACTKAGLSSYWQGPLAHTHRELFFSVYLGSLALSTVQWFKHRRKPNGI